MIRKTVVAADLGSVASSQRSIGGSSLKMKKEVLCFIHDNGNDMLSVFVCRCGLKCKVSQSDRKTNVLTQCVPQSFT